MAININLPFINGEIEAGITIGVDASLPDDKKLSILQVGRKVADIGLVKQHAAMWAYRQFNDMTARQLFVNGILGLIDTGCICHVRDVPDGDWFYQMTAIAPTAEEKTAIEALVNVEAINKAITVAIATKANFWLMNHHTGQGQVAGYVKKVLEVFLPKCNHRPSSISSTQP